DREASLLAVDRCRRLWPAQDCQTACPQAFPRWRTLPCRDTEPISLPRLQARALVPAAFAAPGMQQKTCFHCGTCWILLGGLHKKARDERLCLTTAAPFGGDARRRFLDYFSGA